MTRQRDDRPAPAEPDVSWKNVEDRLGDVDQRLEDVARRRASSSECGAGRGGGRASAPRRVVAAVAERVAAQQPPAGQHDAAQYAVASGSPAPRRRSRSGGTCSGAGAPARYPLVEADRARATTGRAVICGLRRPAQPGLLEQLGQRARATAGLALALGELARVRARDDHEVVARRAAARPRPRTPRAARASRGCDRRRRRPCATDREPEARTLVGAPPRAGTRRAPGTGWRCERPSR